MREASRDSDRPPEFERLAHDAALRGLDKQEGLFSELRARTGILFAASALAASFLGQQAFEKPSSTTLTVLALAAFLISLGASMYVLFPKTDLTFSLAGSSVYEELYTYRDDLAEVHRRLAYDLDRFWESNDEVLGRLLVAFRIAAGALAAEVLLLVSLLAGTLT